MTLEHTHTLLFVDDETSITRALQRLFRKEGYHTLTADSGAEALELLTQHASPISMIISDQRMPGMSGAQFLEKAKTIHPDAIRYLLTGYADMDAVIQAVNRGEIHRYFSKPWNNEDLRAHVRQSLEHLELVMENRRLSELVIEQNHQLGRLNKNLESKVRERTQEVVEKNQALETVNRMLEQSFMDVLRLLASMVETLNPRLGRQMRRVALLARQVGEAMALGSSELDRIEMAGMIHDIGLLSLPEELWTKPTDQLNVEQFRVFSEHPVIGSIILERVDKLAEVGKIVLHHHEFLDGKGFPSGLAGSRIPLGARILLPVSDYCHMLETWPRNPNKLNSLIRRQFSPEVWENFVCKGDPEAIIKEAAEKKLLSEAGRKYDKEVVSALIKQVTTVSDGSPAICVTLDKLKAGMVLVQDLRLNDGRLLLTRGTRLKDASIRSIQTIGERGMIADAVTISFLPDE